MSIVSALVALVPMPSCSMRFSKLLGLYLGGGLVNLSSRLTLVSLTASPSFREGKSTSSLRRYGL